MNTKQLYYQDSYQQEVQCRVVSCESKGNLFNVVLDQTIFYPESGGQPSDRGQLGEVKVEYVRLMNGEIIHQVNGELKPGTKVAGKLDWNWRYKYMKIHTAGHLLHDVLMSLFPDLVPLKGGHGKKPFLEYEGSIDPEKKEEIVTKVNEILNTDLAVVTKESSYDELAKEAKFIPANLPKNKPLRMIRIGDYAPMPDGGVHVKSTKEIGSIWIANITTHESITNVRYGVKG
jgi:Ser-tRNA(Ala) deacylase AlaX